VRHLRLAIIPALALAATACSTGSGTPAPSAAPTKSAAASPFDPVTRIEVRLSDSFTIEPEAMTVPHGVPVTFVVTNTGRIEHEFYLGDEAAQAEHDREMAAGGMAHDEPEGIGVDPGQTRELVYTFAEAGESIAGCHVVGHYAAGMKATIAVTP
jgi:uncharacterized cupredoxin-like copper-binding protein